VAQDQPLGASEEGLAASEEGLAASEEGLAASEEVQVDKWVVSKLQRARPPVAWAIALVDSVPIIIPEEVRLVRSALGVDLAPEILLWEAIVAVLPVQWQVVAHLEAPASVVAALKAPGAV
jgi:hypothetical protein